MEGRRRASGNSRKARVQSFEWGKLAGPALQDWDASLGKWALTEGRGQPRWGVEG